MYWKSIFLLNILLLINFTVTGQTKYEREYRIKKGEVPENARQYIDLSDFDGKIRWYYEENLTGNSIEAKFKYNDHKYSIEFDTLGNFQDIEIDIDFAELPEIIQAKITSALDSLYSKHGLKKIQSQYSGDISSLEFFLKTAKPEDLFVLKYETEVKGRKEGEWKLYQISFNQQGNIENISEIIFRSTYHLEY